MNSHYIKCFLLIAGMFPFFEAEAADVDLSAPKLIGSASQTTGVFQYYELLQDLRFDGGAQPLPLRLFYSPEQRKGHAYLGRNWTIPLFDSVVTRQPSGLLKLKLLCGKTMYVTPSPDVAGTWFNYDGWVCKETRQGGSRVLTLRRDDGWSVTFIDDLVSGATDDKGNEWRWERDLDRRLTALRQVLPANGPVCKLSYNEDGTLDEVRYRKSVFSFHYKDSALHRIERDQVLFRTYELNAKNGSFDVTIKGKARHHKWDVDTGLLKEDPGGIYKITPRPGNRPRFEITRGDGSVDLNDFNALTGIKTTRRQGVSTRTHYHTQQGPLHYKVREVWRKQASEEEFQIVQRYQYNAEGDVVLSDNSGKVTEWLEEQDGRVLKKLIDGVVVHEERFDEKNRLVYWQRDGETFRAAHEKGVVLLYPEGKREEAVSFSLEKFKVLFLKGESSLR